MDWLMVVLVTHVEENELVDRLIVLIMTHVEEEEVVDFSMVLLVTHHVEEEEEGILVGLVEDQGVENHAVEVQEHHPQDMSQIKWT